MARILTTIVVMLLSAPALSEDVAQYTLHSAIVGSSAAWVLPFDKEYAELSQQQRQAFKSQYERMGEADEPPFPLAGLRSLYEPMVKAQARANIEGEFIGEIRVNSYHHQAPGFSLARKFILLVETIRSLH